MSTTSRTEAAPAEGHDFIPLAVPEIRSNEWRYLKECLDTNWVSYLGPFVSRFEEELAAKTGAGHVVSTISGTAALHICLLLAGVGRDDEVVMPGITFVAPANAVRYCNAWPTFVDISENDWQLDIGKLSEFLAQHCTRRDGRLYNRVTGRRIAAILPVHILGGMADIDAVAELAEEYALPLVEDAAECLGATYQGRPIGAPLPSACPPLRLVTTSFNGNKIITTGGGGAILTNDADLAAQAKHLTTTAKADKVEFFHDRVGYNYRLTNIAAALGVAQLEVLEEYVEIKRSIASRYTEAFTGNGAIVTHREPANCRSTFWLYSVMLDRPSRPVIDELGRIGIMSRPIWMPIYRLPPFQDGCMAYRCDFAEEFYRRALSLPSSVGLRKDQQDRVIESLGRLLNGA